MKRPNLTLEQKPTPNPEKQPTPEKTKPLMDAFAEGFIEEIDKHQKEQREVAAIPQPMTLLTQQPQQTHYQIL